MTGVRNFTDLKFWQRTRLWSKEIFFLTKAEPFKSDQRLIVQINDSSESAFANVAEGFGRGTQGEFVQFLGYAIGSLNETQTYLCAAFDREYISKEQFAKLFQEGSEIRKMMVAFIRSMNKPGSGVKHIRKQKSWSDQTWEIYERVTGEQRPELWRRSTGNDTQGND